MNSVMCCNDYSWEEQWKFKKIACDVVALEYIWIISNMCIDCRWYFIENSFTFHTPSVCGWCVDVCSTHICREKSRKEKRHIVIVICPMIRQNAPHAYRVSVTFRTTNWAVRIPYFMRSITFWNNRKRCEWWYRQFENKTRNHRFTSYSAWSNYYYLFDEMWPMRIVRKSTLLFISVKHQKSDEH